jgi:hypothetical protein
MNNYKFNKSCNQSVTNGLPFDTLLTPNDPNYISINQQLAGTANPKTFIKPVYVHPITDLEHWRSNNLINHSHINSQSQFDTYLSGYQVSNSCDIQDSLETVIEDIDNVPSLGIFEKQGCNVSSKHNSLQKKPIMEPNNLTIESSYIDNQDFKERYTSIKDSKTYGYESFACKEDSDTHDRLHNQHLQHIQSSTNTIDHDISDTLKYNKNLFTQTIQPNVYTVNEVIEPVNANIGISLTQQFEPLTSTIEDGSINYRQHDPRVYTPKKIPTTHNTSATESNIYDPRFTGYGTSYRAYTDNNIGQTRFYYDDVDSVRMPNYIVRSNIDFTDYADTYGPLDNNNNTTNIRNLAQNTFLQSSLQHRNDLMERLMRKRNSELWETRKYPIRTFGAKKR